MHGNMSRKSLTLYELQGRGGSGKKLTSGGRKAARVIAAYSREIPEPGKTPSRSGRDGTWRVGEGGKGKSSTRATVV